MLLLHHVLLATVHFELVQILRRHVGVLVERLLIHLIVWTRHHVRVILMLAFVRLHSRLD